MEARHAAGEHAAQGRRPQGPPEGQTESPQVLLDRVSQAAESEGQIAVGAILDAVGTRSFAPLLLLPGLVMVAPVIGDIPGVPVLMGMVVILTSAQLLLRRDHVWLPDWLLRRSVSQESLSRTVRWLRPVAHFLDRVSRPRLPAAVGRAGESLIALSCIAIAAVTPLMEVVPFSANVAGLAITGFGLALVAHDGLLALIALALSLGTFGLLAQALV